MNLDSRWQQLRAAFGVELEERVRSLNQLLLGLERGNGNAQHVAETIESLFREAHSLKGAARAVEFSGLEELAHAIESALSTVRQSPAVPPTDWFDALYRAIDLFGPLYQATLVDAAPPPELNDVIAGLRPGHSAPVVLSEAEHLSAIDQQHPLADAESLVQQELPPVLTSVDPPLLAPSRPGSSQGDTGPRPAESVRVAVNKLDTLLTQAGELTVTHIRIERRHGELRTLSQEFASWRRDWRTRRGLRAHIRRAVVGLEQNHVALVRDIEGLVELAERAEQRTASLLHQVEEITARLRDDLGELGLVAQTIEDEVLGVRLMPVSTIFAPFERMIRDLARDHHKQVRLLVEGGETEIDRKILEQLRDPLMHMLRNAIDHGIETPAQREIQGKPLAGTLRLTAAQRGGSVQIELEDDGAGIDPDRLREVAVAKGLLSSEEATGLDSQAALNLIFHPGFSTTTTVTEISGRGVGMDIVRTNVEHLDGQVRLTSVLGRGTHFTISLPLTLATTRALLVEQSGTTFAIPTGMIERNARIQEQHLRSVEGRRIVQIDGASIPIVELADVLELPRSRPQDYQEYAWRPVFILRQDRRRLAFLIDQLVGEQEIVIKSLGWPLRRVRNVDGVAILGAGQTAVILNPSDLFKTGLKILGSVSHLAAPSVPDRQQRQRVLVVDDSLTTRTLERSILEAAGYETAVAGDGVEALKVLHSQPIDLVVSDINMPRLDGFGLTAEIRRDEKLRRIPVVLVTSLDAREHRDRGVEVGADAYITKADFDQNVLLQTIGRLL